ncbi:MAG TPA: PIG-L family deacetylase [Kofleriaceae bacterium]
MDRPLTVSARELGTPEAAWLGCPQLAACPALELGAPGRVVVIAPHPDDEVLGAGGLMRRLARTGAAITVVAVTDGEASHPRSPTTPPARLAELRAAERAAALVALGVDAEVIRLGIPDGGVANDALAARLAPVIDRATLCLAPWERDGHPDHDATGRAAIAACASAGVRLLRYPVWAWHWASPASDDLPWPRARRIALDADTIAAKRAAIAAYRSQHAPLSAAAGDEPILPAAVLARFERPFEVVLT